MRMHRRDAMLRLGALTGGAMTLPRLLAAERSNAGVRPPSGKSCIFLFMWGGQPQQDMWDLKPGAPDGVRSPFSPIQTRVPGLQLCDQLPRLSEHAEKLAIVRSLTHSHSDHGVSVYHALTGRPMLPPRTFPGNARQRSDFPAIGSIFSYLGGGSALPASISIPRAVAHDGVFYAGTHAGFLGSSHDPIELGRVFNHVQVGPRNDPPAIPLTLPSDMSLARLQARRGLRNLLQDSDRAMQNTAGVRAFDSNFETAYRLLHSTTIRDALNLEAEPASVRDRYGRNEYGESFLTARRLVEAGVRLVSVNWMFITPAAKVYNVWDAHGGLNDLEHGQTGYGMLKADYCLPAFDRAFSALLDDLAQRGLIADTLVACAGEFGRTPRINGNNGRDHWPFCYSAVLAGAGIQGGAIYGASDSQAAYVKENPVTPGDYLATVCKACGLDPNSEVRDQEGRPFKICDGEPIAAILG
ncbi:MAG: DUF1501 domain-containing protein [Planctomycetes bacterium]|nr:DUF1501 domain-containing protein [Planctomycetota bacterium]